MMYDPKYGVPKKLSDFTKEHSAYIEDLAKDFNGKGTWKTVGFHEQIYRDSFMVKYLSP